ncbi:MAG TPA: hypothetical protein VK961_09510 [Chthoniobacter sp.]|nr:hypothetical protein [Chthoniobacter sp.]
MNKLLIPGIAAIAVLCSPIVHAQTVVREATVTTAAPLEAAGTVTEYAPDRVIIRQREGVAPVPYGFARQVEYVDEAGAPVTREVITRDTPVTVRYVQEGDRMLVNRVVVHRRVVAAPATTATVTTTEPVAPVTTSRTTTTTSTTISGHDAKEIEKRREKIAKLEREIAEHPGRDGAREDLAEERAKLERLERDIREQK